MNLNLLIVPLNENLPQPVIGLPISDAAPDSRSGKSHKELFDLQTTPARAGSGRLFAEQPVAQKRKKGGRR
jgi:hypothetical protein